MPTKNKFSKIFCLLLFEGTSFTSFFKDKKSKRNHKIVKIKVYLTFFCFLMEGAGSGSRSGSVQIMTDPGGTNTSAPDKDPQHCIKIICPLFYLIVLVRHLLSFPSRSVTTKCGKLSGGRRTRWTWSGGGSRRRRSSWQLSGSSWTEQLRDSRQLLGETIFQLTGPVILSGPCLILFLKIYGNLIRPRLRIPRINLGISFLRGSLPRMF
jgi:hypothetical protein